MPNQLGLCILYEENCKYTYNTFKINAMACEGRQNLNDPKLFIQIWHTCMLTENFQINVFLLSLDTYLKATWHF